jgi:RNA polymerase sigma factor (sigma-70 family)
MLEDHPPGQAEARSDTLQISDWARLVARIREDDPGAMEELYGVFERGIRYFLLRNLGPEDVEDKVHDCFVIVAQAIRRGELREPERLMGFVRTVVKRQIAQHIEVAVNRRRTMAEFDESMFSISDWKDDPEQTFMARQRKDIARRVLSAISNKDREVLRRFYVEEQTQEQICREMNLTSTQFRLLKSRAKARFGELGKKLAAGRGISLKLNAGAKK